MYNDSDYSAVCAREAKLASDLYEIEKKYSQKEKKKAEEERKWYENFREKEKERKEKYEINENNYINDTIKEIPKNINITYIRSGKLLSQYNKNIRIKDKKFICIDHFTFHISCIYTLDLSNIFIDEDYCILIVKNKRNNKYESYKERKEYYDLERVKYPIEIINNLTSGKSKKVWKDLLGSTVPETSSLIEGGRGESFFYTDIKLKQGPYSYEYFTQNDRSVFIDNKHAKSALAMAMISQLLPYYGGMVTGEEWEDQGKHKYVIYKEENKVMLGHTYKINFFLAFHTQEQRDMFLECNEQLVKDYLMID